MNNKIIIYSTVAIVFASFVFLSFFEMQQADINSKSVWMMYFIDPKSNSLDFTIENHSTSTNFRWEIYVDKEKVKASDVVIQKGEAKTIPVSSQQNMENKKITIIVTSGENKKEIYKSL